MLYEVITIAVRVKGKLDDPLTIAQIDKDQPSMVPASLNPAHDTNLPADMFSRQFTTAMSSFPITKFVVQDGPPTLILVPLGNIESIWLSRREQQQ